MRAPAALACALVLSACEPVPAHAAEPVCMPAAEIGAILSEDLGQVAIASAAVPGTPMLRELWVTPLGGWTLVESLPGRGVACAVMWGDDWREGLRHLAAGEGA